MPYLFCKTHGRMHDASCQQEQENYRQLGETVMIVSGTLNSGPWLCDKCNAELNKGTTAYLMTAYPRHFAEELAGYDYANERRYFRMEKATVRVYGAMPPGGIADPAMLAEDG
jgi:hypothetical protein